MNKREPSRQRSPFRRNVGSFVLFALAAGFGAYMIFVDRNEVSEGERQARKGRVFQAFRRDDITRIELQSGTERIVIEPAATDAGLRWLLRTPYNEPADPAIVDMLVHELEFASRVRTVHDGPKEPVRLRGEVVMGALVQTFSLGPELPQSEASYLTVNAAKGPEAETVVIDKSFANELLKPASAYRDRTFVPYGPNDLTAIEFVRGSVAQFSIERAPDNDFRSKATKMRVARAAVDRIYNELIELRAEAFPNEAETKTATDNPQATLVLIPKDGAPTVRVQIGQPCADHKDDLVAIRTAPDRRAACIPRGVLDGLTAVSSDLEDRFAFSLHRDEVAEWIVKPTSGRSFEFARAKTGWRQRNPKAEDQTSERSDTIDRYLERSLRVEASAVTSVAPVGFETRATWSLIQVGVETKQSIEVGRAVGPAVGPAQAAWFAHRLADDRWLSLAPEDAWLLSPTADVFRSRNPFGDPIRETAIHQMTVDCGRIHWSAKQIETGWRAESPKGLALDTATLLEAIAAVARLKAEVWLSPDWPAKGFIDPSCSVAVETTADASIRVERIRFGQRTKDGMFAKRDGDDRVMLLPLSAQSIVEHFPIAQQNRDAGIPAK